MARALSNASVALANLASSDKYNIRDSVDKKDKSHPMTNALGTCYTNLVKAMTKDLGRKSKAEKTMSDKLAGPDKKANHINVKNLFLERPPFVKR